MSSRMDYWFGSVQGIVTFLDRRFGSRLATTTQLFMNICCEITRSFLNKARHTLFYILKSPEFLASPTRFLGFFFADDLMVASKEVTWKNHASIFCTM